MQFGGTYLFTATREELWRALNDAELLKAAIPGCRRLDWVSESALEAAISVNLGVSRPTFKGDLTLSNVRPAQSYTLSGRGRGGLLGLAGGSADITLTDHDAGCVLDFDASVSASGAIVKLGRKLLGASAQRVIDGFFERFATAMRREVRSLRDDN